MKKLLLLVPALLSISSCSDSNPSPPEVAGVFLDNNSVSAGSVVTTSVTFWVDANKVDGTYLTDPQTVVLNIPIGTTIVAGSSNIGYQGPREPDAVVNCANGSQSLVYNLQYAEIEDPYNFSSFTSVINVEVIVQPAANQQLAQGAASLTEVADPCNLDFTNSVMYFVSGS